MTDIQYRPLHESEYPLLKDFLYLSIFQREGDDLLPRSILESNDLKIYYEDFGTLRDDHSICADKDGEILGIAWCRNIDGYGSVDKKTPELAISVKDDYRNQGIGQELLRQLLEHLATLNYEALSLSVQKENKAQSLYFRLGFKVFNEDLETYTLMYHLGK